MHENMFYSDKGKLLRQAITAWITLFLAVISFATVATVLVSYGVGREESIRISLAAVGTLAVLSLLLIHNYDYSLLGWSSPFAAVDMEMWAAVAALAILVMLGAGSKGSLLLSSYWSLFGVAALIAVILAQRLSYLKIINNLKSEKDRIAEDNASGRDQERLRPR
jgi:hypothetical protein